MPRHFKSRRFLPVSTLSRKRFYIFESFRKHFETVEIKMALQFSATSRGGAKSPETVWNFAKRLENFLAVVEGQGARVGEVAVVCSTQSVPFPGRDLPLQKFLFSPVRIQLCVGTWEALVFREWGWGKTRRCPLFFFSAHNLESETEGKGPPHFPRCQELSVVPRSGQVWWGRHPQFKSDWA